MGYSTAYAIEIALSIEQFPHQEIAARGIYEIAKLHDEFSGTNYEGSSLPGALKGAQTVGFFWESDWPSDRPERPANITPAMKIASYSKLGGPTEINDALKANKAPVVEIKFASDFDNPQKGVVKLSAKPSLLGGHSICVVGYNEEAKQFKFANSWGTKWGDHGFEYISENDLKTI